MPTCSECARPLSADADPRRVTCSATCRSARKRRRDAEEVARLRAALAQTAAGSDEVTQRTVIPYPR